MINLSKHTHLCRALLAMILVVTTSLLSVHAQSTPLPEYQVKAALLYKLTKFIYWPEDTFASAKEPLGICVLGKDLFDTALDALTDTPVRSRRIIVKRVQKITTLKNCQVVFVSSSEQRRLDTILRTLNQQPILLVSDIKRFAQQGGMINLVTVKNKIRFEINPQAAVQARLKINAQLLALATIVHSD